MLCRCHSTCLVYVCLIEHERLSLGYSFRTRIMVPAVMFIAQLCRHYSNIQIDLTDVKCLIAELTLQILSLWQFQFLSIPLRIVLISCTFPLNGPMSYLQ